MVEELNTALAAYQEKWQELVDGRQDKAFFEGLRPTAVGWKVEDVTDYYERLEVLHEHADQIHEGWVNERWLATVHLRDIAVGGLTVVKLMQRRPGSTDATGLDHVDFYFDPAQTGSAKAVLSKEPDLQWNEELNGDHCKWLSVWFAGTEAKLRSDTVVDVCIAELEDTRRQVMGRPENPPTA